MGAGFERYIGRSATRSAAGRLERLGLSMRPAAGLRPAASDDAVVVDDQTTDGRIRPNLSQSPGGKSQRRAQMVFVACLSCPRVRH